MKKMKMYKLILEEAHEEKAYKIIAPAISKNNMLSMWNGNGNFVACTEVTEDFPISIGKVRTALSNAGFGDPEIRVISDLLDYYYENVIRD